MRKTKIHFLKQRGFALVATLSLLILLTLLVGMVSLSSVSLRTSGQGSSQAEARANARLALMLAIGELQRTMGPDMRITGRAELIAKDLRVNATVPTGTPKSWWVGAMGSTPGKGLDATNPAASGNPAAAFMGTDKM